MNLIQEGPRDAKIVIVGEAPGATEVHTGRPFDGAAGDVLDRMLSRTGISRSDVFVTNICHVRPPSNDFLWFTKPKVRPEFLLGLMQLKKDITEIKPNLIVALGSWPLKVTTNRSGITKWRGSILESTLVTGVKVIGTFHPAAILRQWDYKIVTEIDLTRCNTQGRFPEIRRPQRELVLNPLREDTAGLVAELQAASIISVDIECVETPSGWKLACVGFSPSRDRAIVWPTREQWQRDAIRAIVESPVRKVFQNGNFDVTVLWDEGYAVPIESFVWDDMLGHHALFAECAGGEDEMSKRAGKKKLAAIQKGLAFQTSIYTEEPFYKDMGKFLTKGIAGEKIRPHNGLKLSGNLIGLDEQEIEDLTYNALDNCVQREIYDVQQDEIKSFGVQQVAAHEMALIEPLIHATRRGIKIDLQIRDELHAKFTKEIGNLQSFMDKLVGPVNVKSPKQMQDLLFNKLKLPAKYNRKTKNLTANKDAIVELAEKTNHPVLQTILEIRQRRDFIERYLDATVDADGRMRCSFDITGTRSGRLSSRASIYGSGTNLQNIPARKPEGEAIRRMFLADEGKQFVYRDYSQAEARIVAFLARCHGLIELFSDASRDVHTENASRIFGRKTTRLVSDGGDVTDEERYLAKRVVHACNYGMEAARLVQIVNEDYKATGVRIDFRQAQNLIQRYFLLYPEIRETFWKGVENDLNYTRILNTPFGRKRTFYGRWDDKLLREGYSYIPQSTVGDLCCKAVVNCYHQIEKVVPGAEFVLTVHDSIMMQCYTADVAKVADMMEKAMQIEMELNGYTFTIPSDCRVGHNWGIRPKKTPEQNPNGLISLDTWMKEAA